MSIVLLQFSALETPSALDADKTVTFWMHEAGDVDSHIRMIVVTKYCSKCELDKPLSDFSHRTVKGKRYPVVYCKPCMNAYNRERRANGYKAPAVPAEVNTRYAWLRRLRLMGVTEEWYNTTLAAQGGRCAICRTDRTWSRSGAWAVDHDHVTGKARGLLCHACNSGIGHLKDDVEIVRSALAYLKRHRNQVSDAVLIST